MKKLSAILLLFVAITLSAVAQNSSPKYVFYLIGDGMGFEHMKLAKERLCFESFPSSGSVTTRSQSDEVTDSAAAGTALASGKKTSNGTLGMSPEHDQEYGSIIIDAQSAGRKTAIMSSVSLDHATPAAFYAHVPKRSMYYEVAEFVTNSKVDFFAGAGFKEPKQLFDKFRKAGYTILKGAEAEIAGQKIIWIQQDGKDENQVPYKVDRKDEQEEMNLPDMVDEAIEFLMATPNNGFLLVAEAGLIDWAAHENSVEKTRGEVEDFNDAVEEALDFYEEHPTETLIVVTSDHETGGLSLNANGTASWSTGGHSAADVPIFAIGVGAEEFQGKMDNTDVANKLRTLLK